MIKLVVFDFDGVLADSKDIHYLALNEALKPFNYTITLEEHETLYDGLPTDTKLEMLHKNKGLPREYFKEIFNKKQALTEKLMPQELKEDKRLYDELLKLKKLGVKLFAASNATRKTLLDGLKYVGLFDLFDFVLSNNDISNKKPHPDIYLKSMLECGVGPRETLIVEDSKHGRLAAYNSGAYVCGVNNPSEVTFQRILKFINKYDKVNSTIWPGEDVNVLIPMAGAGSRFAKEGYVDPKPLIDVDGKPMIQRVIENLNIQGNFIFIIQKSHYEKYFLGKLLPALVPGCRIVQTDGLTEGAACTTLLAEEYINNDSGLLIANADQFLEWDAAEFMYKASSRRCDGMISVFQASGNKWSYVTTDDKGLVNRLAEKEEISNIATTGLYYYSKGSDYVKYAKQMIQKNIRVNNEFYVAPVYNEAIADGKRISIDYCGKFWGLGTPEDLNYFLKNYGKAHKL